MEKKYFVLEPASFMLDGGAMFGIIPKPLWSKVHPADADNRIDLALRLMLIQAEGKNILIDTGIGDYHGDKFDSRFGITNSSSPLVKALEKINLSPNDITDLIISHLHFDHIGGLTQFIDGQMSSIFQKATIHLHQSHWEYANRPTERDSGSFHLNYFGEIIKGLDEKGQVHWLSGFEGNILLDINFKCSMGHTPYLVHAYDSKFIYMADLIPTSNHISIPWVMGYDISPGITTEDKKQFLQMANELNLSVIFEHDPNYIGAKIILDKKGNYVCGDLIKSFKNIAIEIFN